MSEIETKVVLLMLIDGLAPDPSYLTNLTKDDQRVLKRKYRKVKRKVGKLGYTSVKSYYISKARKLSCAQSARRLLTNNMTEPNNTHYIVIPIDIKTNIPNLDDIAIFPNNAEALKAKAFLKKVGYFTIIIPSVIHLTKDSWVEDWKERLKCQVCESFAAKSREE